MNETEIKTMLDKAHIDGWLSVKERITELERKNNDLAKAYIKVLDENQALKEKLERYEKALYRHCVKYGVDDFCEGDATCPLYPCAKFKEAKELRVGDRVIVTGSLENSDRSGEKGIVFDWGTSGRKDVRNYKKRIANGEIPVRYDDGGGFDLYNPEQLVKFPPAPKPEEVKSLVSVVEESWLKAKGIIQVPSRPELSTLIALAAELDRRLATLNPKEPA